MAGRLFFLFFFCIAQLAFAKPPALTPKDTRNKIDEILRAHVCHQQLTPDLASRAIQNFIEELDPGKTYFIEPDLKDWLEPKEALKETTMHCIEKEDFTTFESIHACMVAAIERRNRIEKRVQAAPLPLGSIVVL